MDEEEINLNGNQMNSCSHQWPIQVLDGDVRAIRDLHALNHGLNGLAQERIEKSIKDHIIVKPA